MTHKLDPLLRPKSIAVIGASERVESVGWRIVHNLLTGKFEGKIYPVNPGRKTVYGLPCYPDLASLPETVDHVAFAVSDYRIEAALIDTIAHGAKAATIMSQLIIEENSEPNLQARVEKLVEESGLILCGANAMGFYNCFDGVWMCGFDTRENHPRGGNVTLISHSGSGMCGIVDCEERLDFNLAVSTGQELSVAMHDYMDFAIEQLEPRVIGLFMETVRDPGAMIAALEKARQRHIPVVAIKVGTTALSARLAESHSGAVAGNDAAYEALFDKFGVQRVRDMDAFATALMMFAQPHPVGPGALVGLHDSGGERQLLIDLAHEMKVPLATLSDETTKGLGALLDPGLPAVNPLDAWGAGGPDYDQVMADCLTALMQDKAASIGAVVHDRAPYSKVYPNYIDYMRHAHKASGKPVFLVTNRQGSGADPAVADYTREGFPVIDGLRSFLTGALCLFNYREFCERAEPSLPVLDKQTLSGVQAILESGKINEFESLTLLREAGLPVVLVMKAGNLDGAIEATEKTGFPVVMKTAQSGIKHKTELGGVKLRLNSKTDVELAYEDIASRIGPEVLMMPMVQTEGVEMLLGMITDPQFGPLVIMGIGGVRVEALKDVVTVFPPFDANRARQLLNRLAHRSLFEFDRGEGLPDMDSFCEAAALFSVLVASLGDAIEEIDINPIIVSAGGCIAVDAMIVPQTDKTIL